MATLSELLQQAVQLHQAGQFPRAEQLYRQILQADPQHTDAWHLLGVLAHQTGHSDRAIEYIGRAVALGAAQPFVLNNLAAVHSTLGRLDEAVASLQQALRLDLGYAEGHYSLGAIRQRQGRMADAEGCYRQALRLRPDHVETRFNLGVVLQAQGRLDEAGTCYQQVLRLRPDHAEAWQNLGLVRKQQGRTAEAQDSYQQALRLRPNYAEAHYHLGIVWHDQGRLGEARACYEQAVRFKPDLAEAHHNLGTVLQEQSRMAEAQACYEHALRLKPNYAEALDNLGTLFQNQSRPDEARTCFERAMAPAPHDRYKIKSALLVPIIPASAADIQEQRRILQQTLDRLSGEPLILEAPHVQMGTTAFHLAYQGFNDRDVQAQLAALFVRATPSLNYVAPHCRAAAPPPPSARPLRIGFISKFFHDHPVGWHYAGLMRYLARDNLRVILFRFAGSEDRVAQAIQQSADEVVTLAPQRDLHLLRQQIAAQQLDVLFYTDIGMDLWTYFLAFARLAPVQCVTAGHPVTTGIPTIDYFISGKDLEPDDARDHYTEHLVRLQNPPHYFERPRLSGLPRTRGDFGLPEGAHLYMCPQTLFKIHPDFDALLGAILRADPQGRVVLFQGQQETWTRLLTERLRRSVPGAIDRVHFLPYQPVDVFLHLLTLAEVLLDTPYFTGSTTSLQALAFGTPVVTLPGRFCRGRQTYCYYRRMGLLDCVAADSADYVRLAVRLATEPAWRAQVRSRILAANDVLFGNAAVVRELEQFFVEAVTRARAARS